MKPITQPPETTDAPLTVSGSGGSPFRKPVKIVVLGASGMLGHKMFQRLRPVFPGTVGFMRAEAGLPPFRIPLLQGADVLTGVDAMDFDFLAAALSAIRPDYIVNCIGVIKQRPQAQDADLCSAINTMLPHRLAALAAEWNGRLIHFSTDCVFSGAPDGNRTRGYTEDDPSDAQDLYGRSKFLGEVAGPNALTLRTSMIGRELTEHHSLLDWLRAQDGRKVRGFRRVIYSGLTTNHLADLVAGIIRNHPRLSGLYQAAGVPISKYDLLCLLREAYRLKVEIAPDDAEQSDRSMCGDKLYRAIGYRAPSWPELVGQLAADPTPYESWLSDATITR